MYPLQNYAEQMGGFDFSLSQRYSNDLFLETNYFNKKTSSSLYPIKKQALQFAVSNTKEE